MTNRIVKLGLCGAGRWGKRYLLAIQANPNLKLHGLFSRNPESANLVPPDCIITSNWEDLIEKIDIDGLIIATPPNTHFKIAKAAIERKIPCMIEKPLCLDNGEAQSLLNLLKIDSPPVLVDHTLLFHPAYQELKKQLAQETIIEISSEGSNWGPFRSDYTPLWDYGAHDIAFCLDLLGFEPDTIQVKMETPAPIIENGHAGSYSFKLTWASGTTAFIKSSNIEKRKKRILEVKTIKKKFIFDDLAENPLVVITDSDKQNIFTLPIKPLDYAIDLFSKSILGQISHLDPQFGVHLASRVIKTLDRAQNSLFFHESKNTF